MAGLARFILLLFLVLAAPVAQPTPYSDNLQDACNKTLFPKVCIQSLTTNPETRTADARRLAELCVNAAKEAGTKVAALAHQELNGVKQEDILFKCLDSCSDDIEEAVAHLSGLAREVTDSKFLEVKSWLSATLGGSSTCEESCKDAPAGDAKKAVVAKSIEFEKLLRVTLDLITEASGSMSESGSMSGDVAVPPTAWEGSASGSYGASAPESYGASGPGSSESASAPGSEAPSSDVSAPSNAPSSEGPSADAPGSYGSSTPSSEAPSSDASAPSNAPTSEAPSGDAPGPSYGSSAPDSEAPSTDAPTSSKAPTSDAPSADAPGPGPSYGSASASGLATDSPSPSPSDADAPSSGSADAPSPGAGAPSYGAAGAPSPSDAGAPDADSPA